MTREALGQTSARERVTMAEQAERAA